MAEQLIRGLRQQQKLEIGDPSGAAETRRVSVNVARELGLSETETSHVAIVATELATNLIKHAKQGQMIIGPLTHGETPGLELLSLDRGPGIANVPLCMRDGYSSAGSLGTGLGAVVRLASEFDIHSIQGKGTAVLARLWAGKLKPLSEADITFGLCCLPMPGEEVCGDSLGYEMLADGSVCMVADGLGHGPEAAVAAGEAVSTLRRHKMQTPAEIVERAHGALRSTRGAALAVAQIYHSQQVLR